MAAKVSKPKQTKPKKVQLIKVKTPKTLIVKQKGMDKFDMPLQPLFPTKQFF